jgi:metal-responsive CopG/Arc/MetJ family transcriptional regulator
MPEREPVKRRISISVTDDLIRILDRLGSNRSRTIEDAVRLYSRTVAKGLRKSVKEGALRRAEDDLRIAADWLSLENEAWDRCRESNRPC